MVVSRETPPASSRPTFAPLPSSSICCLQSSERYMRFVFIDHPFLNAQRDEAHGRDLLWHPRVDGDRVSRLRKRKLGNGAHTGQKNNFVQYYVGEDRVKLKAILILVYWYTKLVGVSMRLETTRLFECRVPASSAPVRPHVLLVPLYAHPCRFRPRGKHGNSGATRCGFSGVQRFWVWPLITHSKH